MPVLTTLMSKPRPVKRERASTVPSGIPQASASRVAVAEMRSESQVTLQTSRSPASSRRTASSNPCPISSTAYGKSASVLPAMGTNSACPNLSTPKALITACVLGATMKSANALPPATLTRGPLAGLTSITE